MLGAIQSALVLGHAPDTHLGEFHSNPLDAKGVFDERFVDDGQVFGRPFQFDPLLRALDAALVSFGATQGMCRARQRQELCAPAVSARAPDGVSGMGHAVRA